MTDLDPPDPKAPIDWEAFYASYRKPGYVPGFEIQTQLGSGAFGLVFKAVKESINKPYAIKFLKVDSVDVRQAVLRELDSVRLFARVDHPNLVSIEDLGEVDGIPYIVMAFAGDDTLRRRIDSGDLTRAQALGIFGQICRGVQALHDHSLVHFDIKPANVYLKGDVARIGDYGLSKLVTDSRNSLSMGRGTPYYMAPELLRRKGDARSDIYALGVVLYELLCGVPPFRGDSEWEVLRKHEEEAPDIPASIGEPERGVIARALEKDPGARFQSVRDLMTSFAGGEVAPAPPPAPAPAPGKPVAPVARSAPRRRRGAGTTIAWMVLLLMGSCVGLSMLMWTRVQRPIETAETLAAISTADPAVPVPRSSHLKLLEIAENFEPRVRAGLIALSERLPRDFDNDGLYARSIANRAGPLLEDLLAELERVGTLEALVWRALLVDAMRESVAPVSESVDTKPVRQR